MSAVGMRLGAAAALAVAVSLALALVPARASATETIEEYVAAAEPICKANVEQNSKVLKGVKRQVKKGKNRKAARRFRKASRLFNRALEAVDAIEKPPEQAATLSKWMRKLRVEVRLLKKMSKAIKKDKLNKAQRIRVKLDRKGRKANNVVLGFGFNHCLVKPNRFR
jgi:hypothetical protein